MTGIRILQIDAFADRPFSGNPAAVCLLRREHDADWMQHVAAEMNLSETAFVRPLEDGFELRWFTPAIEVDLCGHATLAAAHALWTLGEAPTSNPIRFHTKSGVLTSELRGDLIELDFPATPPEATEPLTALMDALGVHPIFVGQSRFDQIVVAPSEYAVRSLKPDLARLRRLPVRGVIVTSRSDDARFDFVSRFFAPAAGVDEDPVTRVRALLPGAVLEPATRQDQDDRFSSFRSRRRCACGSPRRSRLAERTSRHGPARRIEKR